MSTSLLDARGIGQATAKILAGQGIISAEDPASVDIARIVSIQGFSELRAAQVIRDIQGLFPAVNGLSGQHVDIEITKITQSAKLKKTKSAN